MNKNDKIRDLFAAALNEAISRGLINLHKVEKFSVEFECELFGKRTLVLCEGHDEGSLEAVITVWWGVPENITSIRFSGRSRKLYTSMDFRCSAWLERKDGLWLEGIGGEGFFEKYCSRRASCDLFKIPEIVPNGFKKEGKYYL
ncbi:MAG: hypothetical protein DRH24_08535 [Deltaproteobacteria bacterium]|nr:MAG: hypothetical protein DRH24_08535 [Deltaproteobacteria bacterium]